MPQATSRSIKRAERPLAEDLVEVALLRRNVRGERSVVSALISQYITSWMTNRMSSDAVRNLPNLRLWNLLTHDLKEIYSLIEGPEIVT